MKYKILKDCFCEYYINEISNHWRQGIKKKKLSKDDIVTKIGETRNLYGFFFKVEDENGETYEIPPNKLRKIN